MPVFRQTKACLKNEAKVAVSVLSRQSAHCSRSRWACSRLSGAFQGLLAHFSRRTDCTLPSRATLALRPRNFLTVSSATFGSFPKANGLTTMFALWEWKCSTPVELLPVAGVRGGRVAELVLATAAAASKLGALITQNVLLVTGEND
jgi:hypothetical protein